MRRLWTATLALAALAFCWTASSAQEKIAAPAAAPTTQACDAACLHKVCIAVPDVKKISKTVYSCQEKDICLHKCVLGGHRCDASCNDQCGKPRTVRVLMKRVVTEECPTTKCVVSHQAAAPSRAPACKTHGRACTDPCPAQGTTTVPAMPPANGASNAGAAPEAARPLPTIAPTVITDPSR